jgi:hypothetical protein
MEAGMGHPAPRAPTTRDRIRELAIEVLRGHPTGLPYRTLAQHVLAADPTLNSATVLGYLADTERTFAGLVYRPSRGLFRLAAFQDAAFPDAAFPDAAFPDAAFPDAAVPDAAVAASGADARSPRWAGAAPEPRTAVVQEYVGVVLAAIVLLVGALLVAMGMGYAVWVGP